MDSPTRTPAQQKTAKALMRVLRQVNMRLPDHQLAYDMMLALEKAGLQITEISAAAALVGIEPDSNLVN